MKKEFGGLGIPNLKDVNLCLLGSWIGTLGQRVVFGRKLKMQSTILDNQTFFVVKTPILLSSGKG
jgi:glycopeptide antibiotics resistance protein